MKSIIPDDREDRCYLCGRYIHGGHVHHMLHGVRRKTADRYGLTVHLCHRCHIDLHDHGVMDAELQELAQNVFEDRYGHAEFMQVFGKNFRRMDNETDY